MQCLNIEDSKLHERAPWSQSKAAWSTGIAAAGLFLVVLVALLAGCSQRPAILPNSDPALRKTPAEFAAIAATHHPYKASAPYGGDAQARASIDYGWYTIQLTNLSDEDWNNVEVWVNHNWVVFLPKLPKGAQTVSTIDFNMLYDGAGHPFLESGTFKQDQIKKIEIYHDGKLYNVRFSLAD